MEGVVWDELSEKRRARIQAKTEAFAAKLQNLKPAHVNLKHKMLFAVCKALHKDLLKNETAPGADNRYWMDKRWIRK
jgi:hypothetical protein